MKRNLGKLMAWVLTLAMLLSLVPMGVYAASTNPTVVYIGYKNMGDGSTTTYYKNGSSTGTESDYNAKVEKIDGKLTVTLKDLYLGSAYYYSSVDLTGQQNLGKFNCGIYLPADVDLILEGENRIFSPATTQMDLGTCGIYNHNTTTISGEGSLTVIAGDASGYNGMSHGIMSDIVVKSGTITTTGGTAKFYGSGVFGNVTMEGGTLTARGGNAEQRTFGIYGWKYVQTGGTVNATGGTWNGNKTKSNYPEWYSAGIALVELDAMNISGGTLNATGGSAPYSFGIYGAYSSSGGRITISGGTVTAKGGEATLSSTHQGMSAGIANYFKNNVPLGSVNISGGTVRAQGGKGYRSAGIYTNNATISAAGLTAQCGEFESAGYGLYFTGGSLTGGTYGGHDNTSIESNPIYSTTNALSTFVPEGYAFYYLNTTVMYSLQESATKIDYWGYVTLQEIAHRHTECARTSCSVDHDKDGTADGHAQFEWEPLDVSAFEVGTFGYNMESGHYYLEENLTLSKALFIDRDVEVELCLNGKQLIRANEGQYKNNLIVNGHLAICDCVGSGKIIDNGGSYAIRLGYATSNSIRFDMYGGTVESVYPALYVSRETTVANIYGGTLKTTGEGQPAVSVRQGAALAIHGGTINSTNGTGVKVYYDAAHAKIYGGTITGKTYGVDFETDYISMQGSPVINGTQADLYTSNEDSYIHLPQTLSGADTYSVLRDGEGLLVQGGTNYASRFVSADKSFFLSQQDDDLYLAKRSVVQQPRKENNYTVEVSDTAVASYKWYSVDVQGDAYVVSEALNDQTSKTLNTSGLTNGYYLCRATYSDTYVLESEPVKYVAPFYDVIFDANGGNGTMADQTVAVGEATALTQNAYTNYPKVFMGWNTKADGTGTNYADQASVTDLVEAGENITLYAQWKIVYKDYRITSENPDYDHAQSVLGEIATVTHNENNQMTIRLEQDVYGRIVFGYTTSSDHTFGTYVLDLNGHTITGGERNEALCLDNGFQGTVIVTGEGTLEEGQNHLIYVGSSSTLLFDVAQGKEYFALTKDGAQQFDAKNTSAQQRRSHLDGDVLTIAQGMLETYTVTFNANGGSGSMSALTVKELKTTALPENAFSKTGYTFAGWNTKADGTGASYAIDGNVVDPTSDIELFAKWNVIPAQVPTISAEPEGLEGENAPTYGEISADDKLSFTAEFDATLYDVTYQWYKNTEETKTGAVAVSTTKDLVLESNLSAGDYYYYCKITVTRKDNGETASVDTDLVKVTVNKATPAYTVPTGIAATYGNTLSEVALPSGWSWKTPSAAVGNAGTNSFAAVFTPADTTNYKTVEELVTVEVAKAMPTYEVPTGVTASYGDALNDVVLPAGWAWKNLSASVGGVGTNGHVAIYTPADTENYTSAEETIMVNVVKAIPSYEVPTGITATFGDTLSDIVLPDGWTWKEPSASVAHAGTNNLVVVFTPADTTNYKAVEVSITVEVAKATPDYAVPTDITATYGNTLSDVTLPAGWSWVDTSIVIDAVGTHSYTAVYTPADTDNYNIVEGITISVLVNKAMQAAPATPIAVAETIKAKADGKITGVDATMEYKKQGDADYIAITGDTVENLAVGTYLVRYKENDNYFAGADLTVEIAEGVLLNVTFNVNGGSEVTAATCEYNQAVAEPSAPTKAGYEFIAWFTEETLENKWNFENGISVDTTLYAKWVRGVVSENEAHLDDVAANGLNTVAKVVEDDVTLVVLAEVELLNDADQTAIKEMPRATKKFGFFDIKIQKAQGGYVSEAANAIEIILPFDFEKKEDFKAYRVHNGTAQEFTMLDARATAPYTDGTCYVDAKNGYAYVYASKFSTYAIGYNDVFMGGGVTYYVVKFDTNGGSKIANKNVSINAKIVEPSAPTKEGYIFDGWYTDKDLTKAYNFANKVNANMTLYAKWTAQEQPEEEEKPEDTHDCPSKAFDDLDTSLWYHLDTDYVIANGLMKGMSETEFMPSYNLSRAMLVTVLYRMEGEPAVNRSIPFADVDLGAYYANAVIWAKQNGIVMGMSETEFMPDLSITREQIATIMLRYAQYKGYDVSVGEDTNILSYEDFDSISEYAIRAIQWSCGSGLMQGRSETTFNPKDNAMRSEIAAILHRFVEAHKE